VDLLVIGLYPHPLVDLGRTRWLKTSETFDFHHTYEARGKRLEARVVAKSRYLYIVTFG
jgi:hypothetical protein